MNNAKKIKIIHVVASMNMGGAETWLMHVLRNIDRSKFQLDFMVHTLEQGKYDDEVRALGGKIIPVRPVSDIFRYSKSVKKALREHGHYDVIHCHRAFSAGRIMRIASQQGIKNRIVHFHGNVHSAKHKTLRSKIYMELTKPLINRYATLGIACSEKTAEYNFGRNWQQDKRWKISHCGVDFSDFHKEFKLIEVRKELGVSADTFVVGHIGRFTELKNHPFIIKVFNEVVKKQPNSTLLLVGDGPSRSEIVREVNDAGLTDKVVFTGLRNDIPRLMLGAMDLFLFPSISEGLGLVLVEAQAAALLCVCSDVIPAEADIVEPLINRLPLSLSARVWADKIIKIKQNPPTINKTEALMLVEASNFNIKNSIKEFQSIYLEVVER